MDEMGTVREWCEIYFRYKYSLFRDEIRILDTKKLIVLFDAHRDLIYELFP